MPFVFFGTVRKTPLLIIGLISGILLYLGYSIILSFLLLVSIYYFINSRTEKEKNILLKLVLLALILRLIFFGVTIFLAYASTKTEFIKLPFLTQLIGHAGQVVRDFTREITNGKQLSRYFRGEFGNIHPRTISHHGLGYLHIGAWTQGVLNFAFGESIFNLLIFPLIDLWAVIIVYYLAKIIFDERAAVFSSYIYAIIPSIIVISCSNIRFSMGIFSFLLIALSLVKFSKTNSLKYLIPLIIGAVLFRIFKDRSAKPVLLFLPFILFFSLNIKLRMKFVIITLSAIAFLFLLGKAPLLKYKITATLQDMVHSQVAFVSIGEGSTYKIYDEFIYDIKNVQAFSLLEVVKTLSKGLVRGLIYFIFAPFPWKTSNTLRLYAYPYILFWYFIIPFTLLGMIRSLFLKIKGALSILLLCSSFTIVLSLVLGNEGIAARYRELLSPIYYIFACSILTRLVSPSKVNNYNMKDG